MGTLGCAKSKGNYWESWKETSTYGSYGGGELARTIKSSLELWKF